MRIQVIQDHPNARSVREVKVNQFAQANGKVNFLACGGDFDMSPSSERLEQHEQITRPFSVIFVIKASFVARLSGQWVSNIAHQLHRALIKAYHRSGWVIGFGIQVQHIFHPPHEFAAHGRYTPGLLLPGFEFVFFKVVRTVSSEMVATISNSTNLSAKSCMVQVSRPWGASLHARATRKASCLPSNFVGAPRRGSSLSAQSRPPSLYRSLVRQIVLPLVLKIWLMSLSAR